MKKLLCAILTTVLLLAAVSCQKSDEPISVTKTVHGCEFTITLDKSKYGLDDTVKATVSLVNKSGEDILLYSPTLSPYFTILFSEDGILKFGDNVQTGADMIKSETLSDNEEYTDTKTYDLDSSKETEGLLKDKSEWKIKAYGTIVIKENGEEKHEDISVEIIVPH